ncbi:MAG TPA: RNA-binding protein [Polyangia bacterium]
MSARLFVDKLPAGTTEEALRALFGRSGRTVVSVTIMTDRQSGESHGYAFVEMGSSAAAAEAVEALHGSKLHGQLIHVSLARPRADRSKAGA